MSWKNGGRTIQNGRSLAIRPEESTTPSDKRMKPRGFMTREAAMKFIRAWRHSRCSYRSELAKHMPSAATYTSATAHNRHAHTCFQLESSGQPAAAQPGDR